MAAIEFMVCSTNLFMWNKSRGGTKMDRFVPVVGVSSPNQIKPGFMFDAGSISNADTDLPFGIQDLLPLILRTVKSDLKNIDF